MSYQQIWPTTIFKGDISNEFTKEDRDGLIKTGKYWIEKFPYTFESGDYKNREYNIFDSECPFAQKYKKILVEKMRTLLEIDEHPYPDVVDMDAILLARRFDGNGYRQTPHYHRGGHYVAIFYADLDYHQPENSIHQVTNGDLYLLDPVSQRSSASNGNVCYRITPHPGLLVIHPSNIAHSTDPYYAETTKCLFVANIRLVSRKNDPYYSSITK